MTEQPPSAEALELVSRLRKPQHQSLTTANTHWHELSLRDAGKAIDALIAQRVSAETARWQDRDRQRLHQIATLQETAQSLQSARAERPAPEGAKQDSTGEQPVRWGVLRLLSGDLASDEEGVDAELDLDDFQFWFQENPKHTGFKQILINLSGEQWGKLKELPLVEERSPQPPSALASTGEQPASPAAVVDYTERDRLGRLVREAWVRWARTQPNPKPSWLVPYDDLSEADKEADRQIGEAIAADRNAAAIRAFGQRVWSDTEEVAYQAGVSDTRERLREPGVREAVARVICCPSGRCNMVVAGTPDRCNQKNRIPYARAAPTKIAEMLR